jgi:hypothetical protein
VEGEGCVEMGASVEVQGCVEMGASVEVQGEHEQREEKDIRSSTL